MANKAFLRGLNSDWAEDDEYDELPAQQIINNKDGTKTMITYRINDDGKKVKTTRRIKQTIMKEHVNPYVAERRKWAKFGLEKGHAPGPSFDTTSVAENIVFRPSTNWKASQKDDEKEGEKGGIKEQLKDKKVKCRICNGEHFTARCPFKDTMAPVGEVAPAAAEDERPAGGSLGATGGSYVPPHLRKGGAATGERAVGGKFERDDLATLRVTNVSWTDIFSAHCLLYLCLSDANAILPSLGLRVGRGTRASRSLREIWKSHKSILGEGQRNKFGQGLRFHQLPRPRRCCPCLC